MPFTAQWEIISCLIWMSNWRNWTYPVPNSCACNYFNQVRPYQISFHVAHAIMEAQRHISLHFLLLLLTEAYPDSCEVFRWLSESFVILPRLFHSNSSNRKPIICCNHILPISSSFSEKWNKEIKKRQARIIKKNEEKKKSINVPIVPNDFTLEDFQPRPRTLYPSRTQELRYRQLAPSIGRSGNRLENHGPSGLTIERYSRLLLNESPLRPETWSRSDENWKFTIGKFTARQVNGSTKLRYR